MATISQKINLLRGLLSGTTAKTGPFYVDIDITRRCNLRCFGCPYHSPVANIIPSPLPTTTDISFDMVKELCKELKIMNTHSLIFQGPGEPLMHPEIFDIISFAKAKDFQIMLLTNGSMLDKNAVHALIDTRLDIVKIGLWASSVEQFQQTNPIAHPDFFEKIIEGMKLLSSIKVEMKRMYPIVNFCHVINKYNFHTIDNVVNLAMRTGCNGLFFSIIHNINGASTSFLLSAEEEQIAQSHLIRAKKRLNDLSIKHNIDEVLRRFEVGGMVWKKFPCYIAWFHARVGIDGEVTPCGHCDIVFGNIYENTFHEIWNGLAIRTFRKQTLTRQGLSYMSKNCDCFYCCFLKDNIQVHRLFKWFFPFSN